MSDRYFKNTFPDYDPTKDGDVIDLATGRLRDEAAIVSGTRPLLIHLENVLSQRGSIDLSDNSVYTGLCGYAYLYYFLSKKSSDETQAKIYLNQAKDYADKSLIRSAERSKSFLCGISGPLTMSALIYHKLGQQHEAKVKHLILELLSFVGEITTRSIPDEYLYGRAGYLYSLTLIRNEICSSSGLITDQVLKQVVRSMIESGIETSSKVKNMKNKPPLFYIWHDTAYVGAAHGFAGIIYLLLKCSSFISKSDRDNLIRPTIDFLLEIRFPSGNTCSSLESKSDRLVHWCHGAPGLTAMYLQAHKIFQDEKYLQAAIDCGNVIWNRGLLYKGYGLCHGIAGNAYSFLSLYRSTHDKVHLHRAVVFAKVCLNYGEHGCRTPDRPYSLFEGLAGTIYFLNDILSPKRSLFPGYEVNDM